MQSGNGRVKLQNPDPQALSITRVAIIGGGPGGLMTAYLLQQRSPVPLQVTIFEGSERIGGKIITGWFEGASVPYEAGAAELYDYSAVGPDPLRELVADLGLITKPMDGKTVVLDDKLLKTDDDIRRLLGEETHRAIQAFDARAKSLMSPQAYYDVDARVSEIDPLLQQRFSDLLAEVPDPTARKYIRVLVHSDLAAEPDETSALYGLQNYLMNDPAYMRLYNIDGGIERLCGELAKRIHSRILLSHRVLRVGRTPQDTYQVTAKQTHQIITEEYDFVVVALPVNWIQAIEWAGEKLAAAMQAHHAYYDHPAHYLRASLLFQSPFWRSEINESYFMLDAFGGCCVYDESSRGHCGPYGVLGWLLAGEAAMTLGNLRDDVLVRTVLNSLPTTLQHGRELFLEGRVHRWVGTVNAMPGGSAPRDLDARHLPEPDEHSGLFVVGDYLFDSTVNGVLDSADYVADSILEEIQAELSGATAIAS